MFVSKEIAAQSLPRRQLITTRAEAFRQARPAGFASHRPALSSRARYAAFRRELDRLQNTDSAVSRVTATDPRSGYALHGLQFRDPEADPDAQTVVVSTRIHRYEDFSELVFPLFDWLRQIPQPFRRKVIVQAFGVDYGDNSVRRHVRTATGLIVPAPAHKIIKRPTGDVFDPNRFFSRSLVGPPAIEALKHHLLGPNAEREPGETPIPQQTVSFFDIHGSNNSARRPELFLIGAPRFQGQRNDEALDFFARGMERLAEDVPILRDSRPSGYYRRYQPKYPGLITTEAPTNVDTSEKFAAEEAGIARATTIETPLGVPFPVGIAITVAGLSTQIGLLIGLPTTAPSPAVQAINLTLGRLTPFWTQAELMAVGVMPGEEPAVQLIPALRQERLWVAA
jgi:hypothetical protein